MAPPFRFADIWRSSILTRLSRRDRRLDLLRGLCLIVMTINHLPPMLLHTLTYETLGYITSAEGFVLISGLTAGWVYSRTPSARIWLRCGYIYSNYCVLVSILSIKETWHGTLSLKDLLLRLAGMGGATQGAGLLLLYLSLFLTLPFLLKALKNGRATLVSCASIGLWLLGQLRLGPEVGVGYLFSWQLLFVAGVCFGYSRYRNIEMPGFSSLRLPIIASIAFTIFFVLRHPITHPPLLPLDWQVTSKAGAGLARVVNVGLLAFLIARIPKAIEAKWIELAPSRALRFLGRHSLQVFGWQAVIVYSVKPYTAQWTASSLSVQLLITAGIVLSLFIPACAHQCFQAFQDYSRERFVLEGAAG